MKLLAGLFIAASVLPTWALEKMTAVTADGVSYVQIQDAHVVSGGRVVLLYPSGGATVAADKLPRAFLDSWGITPAQLARSKAAAEQEAAESLNQAIRAGSFRKVQGVIYDLRKPQTGWMEFTRAKILQIAAGGALLDPAPDNPNSTPVFIRNLPAIYADNQIISTRARSTGTFSYLSGLGYTRTVRAYDAGHVCTRSEIPEAMLKGGLASVAGPAEPPSADQAIASLPDHERLHGIGSGFFVSEDGYLLTSHHVVKDAHKIRVKYRNQFYPAKVVAQDPVNDLAVLKVQGADFKPLAITRKQTADLGQEVFTIGFPNIQMQGLEPKYTDGKISSLAGMQDDPAEYQISVPVQPGNSGGPLCDSTGQEVGVIVARLSDLAVLETSCVVPQNDNYAVKARHVVQLLQKVKDLTPPQNQDGKPANPVKTVENAIAMVLIY